MREATKISLGGAVKMMRPTFEAYGEIETRTGLPLRSVYTAVVTGSATLETMATVVLVGMSQVDGQTQDARTGQGISVEGVAERLYENGVWSDQVIGPIADFLASLGWTPEQRKKIEAELAEQEGTTLPSA